MPWLALAALTALAAFLRAINLDGGLWWDEIRTLVDSVRHPLAQIVTTYPRNNQHTLYSVLAHAAIALLGEHPWTLRLPAAVFGALTPALIVLFAREFTGRLEALLAGTLLAVSYHHVWFSQNARGYTALAFLALLATWLLLRGLHSRRTGDFVAYAVVAALGAWMHLTMVFMVFAHALACLLLPMQPGVPVSQRWRGLAVGFGLAAVFTLLLYAPSLADVRHYFGTTPEDPSQTTTSWAVQALWRGSRIGVGSGLVALTGAVLLAAGTIDYWRQSRFLAALFVLPGPVTVLCALAAGQPLYPRFLFFLAGFAMVVVVRGSLVLGRWVAGLGRGEGPRRFGTVAGVTPVAAMIAVSAATLPPIYGYPKQDYDGAMRFVQGSRQDGDPVVTLGGAVYPYERYYGQSWPRVRSLAELQAVRAGARPVWAVYTLMMNIEFGSPDLMRELQAQCGDARRFRGTLDGGDITVCRLPPAGASTGSPPR